MKCGIRSSHLTSHSPLEADASSDALTRTGYGVRFSVTVPPRAAGVALRGRGAGWAPVRRWGHGIDVRRAAGPADQTRRDCDERVPEHEGPRCEPAVPRREGSLVLVGSATPSRVKDAIRVIAHL